MTPEERTIGDYTGHAHGASSRGGAILSVLRGAGRWAAVPARRWWTIPAIPGLAAFAVLLPFDRVLVSAAVDARGLLWGDAARVVEMLGEYGQGVSIAVVAFVVWRLDPGRRRMLMRWLVSLAIAFAVLTALKMLAGRPRPRFDDPWVLLGPFGQYPLGPGRGVHYAWEFWVRNVWELWSFPSSHAAYAVLMTVFLSRAYPPLRVPAIVLAVLACLGRVLHGAHYPSDVAAGAALGAMIGRGVMRSFPPAR